MTEFELTAVQRSYLDAFDAYLTDTSPPPTQALVRMGERARMLLDEAGVVPCGSQHRGAGPQSHV